MPNVPRPASLIQALRAVGTIHPYANRDQPTAWSTVATLRGPDRTEYALSRAGRHYLLVSQSGKLTWKRPPKDQEARALEDGFSTSATTASNPCPQPNTRAADGGHDC